MTDIVIALLGSSVLSALISGVFQLINNRKKNLSKFENGMKLLLLADIKQTAKELKSQGKKSKTEYDSFVATYEAYKSLGGDGWADKVKSEVDSLPIDYEE